MKSVLFGLLFLSTFVSYGQNSNLLSPLTPAELDSANFMFKEMLRSDSYLRQERLAQQISRSLKGILKQDGAPIGTEQEKVLPWIKLHIKETAFASYAEAEREIRDLQDITALLARENKQLFLLMERASAEQRKKIQAPMMDRVNLFIRNNGAY